MSFDALWLEGGALDDRSLDDNALDGNALAGLLAEIFATEMTAAQHTCRSCATRSAVGAHRAYRGAGVVLRCPVCGDVALRVTTLADRHVVRFSGEWTLQAPLT